jgi:hypothetical protein
VFHNTAVLDAIDGNPAHGNFLASRGQALEIADAVNGIFPGSARRRAEPTRANAGSAGVPNVIANSRVMPLTIAVACH